MFPSFRLFHGVSLLTSTTKRTSDSSAGSPILSNHWPIRPEIVMIEWYGWVLTRRLCFGEGEGPALKKDAEIQENWRRKCIQASPTFLTDASEED